MIAKWIFESYEQNLSYFDVQMDSQTNISHKNT